MSAAAPEVTRAPSSLDFLSVGLFGSVMGLAGRSVGWSLAWRRCGGPEWLALAGSALGVIAAAVFVAMLAGDIATLFTAFDAVRAEFGHPIARALFGTPRTSLLLLPIPLAPYNLTPGRKPWALGVVGMVAFARLIVSRWLSDRQQAAPTWIIPVVGLLDLPLAAPSLALPPMQGLMIFALAVGLFFAMPLFSLIYSRLLSEPPLPDALKLSLRIPVAPFAVGCSACKVTTGRSDLFFEALVMPRLFLVAVLLGQLRQLPICCPFRMAWWAVSFPLSACAIGTLRYGGAEHGPIASHRARHDRDPGLVRSHAVGTRAWRTAGVE